jgi:hypothetical protein
VTLGQVCKHGQLARSCDTCQLKAELASLRHRLEIATSVLDDLVKCSCTTGANEAILNRKKWPKDCPKCFALTEIASTEGQKP